ncbi:MAG: hypothetical protein IPL61_04040 [Myxococcales bacterium]|nr:hypothetical protein [Myxococcales bacterium]
MRRPRPQRYQLSKRARAVVAAGHPWIFRGLVSSAAAALADGQWLALYDGGNQVVGHGVYAAEGAIAIRVLGRDPVAPRAATFDARIAAALARRKACATRPTASARSAARATACPASSSTCSAPRS